MRCIYCFQNEKPEKDVFIQKNVIDRFAQFCKEQGFNHIHFFGGEPLLAKLEFKYAVETISKMIPDVSFEIVTNGTLIDKDIIQIFRDYDFWILLSLDGPKEFHNKYRGGYERIEKYLPELVSFKNIYVVTQVAEVKGLSERVKAIWSTGLKKVALNILENYNWYKEDDVMAFEREYESLVLAMLRGEGILLCALDLLHAQEVVNYEKGCGALRNDFACDIEGNLYLCFRFVELGSDFSVGNIWKGIDYLKAQDLRKTIKIEINRNNYCYEDSDYCPVSLYKKNKRFDAIPPLEWCEIMEMKHKIVAKYYYELKHLQETLGLQTA